MVNNPPACNRILAALRAVIQKSLRPHTTSLQAEIFVIWHTITIFVVMGYHNFWCDNIPGLKFVLVKIWQWNCIHVYDLVMRCYGLFRCTEDLPDSSVQNHHSRISMIDTLFPIFLMWHPTKLFLYSFPATDEFDCTIVLATWIRFLVWSCINKIPTAMFSFWKIDRMRYPTENHPNINHCKSLVIRLSNSHSQSDINITSNYRNASKLCKRGVRFRQVRFFGKLYSLVLIQIIIGFEPKCNLLLSFIIPSSTAKV